MSRVERLANNSNPAIAKRAWEQWQQSGAVGSIETAKIQQEETIFPELSFRFMTTMDMAQ